VVVSPREKAKWEFVSREAATAVRASICGRRFAAWNSLTASDLRADARSYLLPPLRG
jgi:hypothetical protein